jgi:cytidine diphosphoramidate kinase
VNCGTLYWITGLSGAGKTTIGKALYEQLKHQKPNVVFLDGDVLRSVFGILHGHSVNDRKKLAQSYSNLCKMLTDQGMDVVCATMSLFREVHEFNRSSIENYYEIFIECEMQELISRDQKEIYSRALKGDLENVIGINMPYDRPEKCDLVIDNTDKNNIQEKVQQILTLKSGMELCN